MVKNSKKCYFKKILQVIFLENNNRSSGPIIEFDTRCQLFWNYEKYCKNKNGRDNSNAYALIKNSEWSNRSQDHKKIAFYALSKMNELSKDFLKAIIFK
jgi:hypothetical protein